MPFGMLCMHDIFYTYATLDCFALFYHRKNIVFGKLVEGDEVLKKIENAGDDEGRPAVLVKIVNSGEINYGRKTKTVPRLHIFVH